MNDLPALYAAVCAKRPELAVESLKWTEGHTTFYWLFECILVQEEVAAALILARWVEALPDKHALTKLVSDSWAVWTFSTHPTVEGIRPTPIEAIAAYYLGDTQ